jgi:hypothetical protein
VSLWRFLIPVAAVAAVAAPVGADAADAAPAPSHAHETARLTVHSTRFFRSVTARDGAPTGLGQGRLTLTLNLGSRSAVLELAAPGGGTKYSVTIGNFLAAGGTWIVPGSAVGSSAADVALAIYAEGPGSGKGKAKITSADYAHIDAFTEKTDTAVATIGLTSKPLHVGRTTFAVVSFYGHKGCRIVVHGPQIHNKGFNLGVNLAEVVASPKGSEAFVVTATHYRG